MSLTKSETRILSTIPLRSDNDPNNPEFPVDAPKFPATPTYQIHIDGLTNVWYKDESHNLTGTHKDRMAWEIIMTYRDFLLAKKRGRIDELPSFSIISSGSAALAIQILLKKYQLPDLNVLLDIHTPKITKDKLNTIGCQLYETDLSIKALSGKEILALTNNPHGIDISSEKALGSNSRFYDWLSYEILNLSPNYCFIPYGTGNLFENILNVNRKEVSAINHDPRFSGDPITLSHCHFLGATTSNPHSKVAEKLYSPHLPFKELNEQWLTFFKRAGYCGDRSSIAFVREAFIEQALDIIAIHHITAEPSGTAGLALLLQMKESVEPSSKVLIIGTGKSITR